MDSSITPEALGQQLYDECNQPAGQHGVEHINWTIPILLIDTTSLEACIDYYRHNPPAQQAESNDKIVRSQTRASSDLFFTGDGFDFGRGPRT